jgi:hypothetical protein
MGRRGRRREGGAMPKWKILTLSYWMLVAKFVTPLLLSAAYGAVLLEGTDPPDLR